MTSCSDTSPALGRFARVAAAEVAAANKRSAGCTSFAETARRADTA